MRRLTNPLKIEGCKSRLSRLGEKAEELRRQLANDSYPSAVFGSKRLHHKLSLAHELKRREVLRTEWKERRSNHFVSVGAANAKGNGNTRLFHGSSDESFKLEVRNWPGGDLSLPLRVPERWRRLLGGVIEKADAAKRGPRGKLREGCEGLAYTVRVIRSTVGYQVHVSFELKEPVVEWNGRIAGIDLNPEGIGCTIVSSDGNLIATRFFRDDRLITGSMNKRKWILENLVNRMLRWCRDTFQSNMIAVEDLKFKGAYEDAPEINLKLSNFMKRKMLQ